MIHNRRNNTIEPPDQKQEISSASLSAYSMELEDKTFSLYFVDNKIYQYISTDKTILFILDGDKMALKNTFSEYGRFIFVENNKDDIKDTG